MEKVRPVYLKLLAVAVAVFVAGVAIALSDLYAKVGQLLIDVDHLSGKCTAHQVRPR